MTRPALLLLAAEGTGDEAVLLAPKVGIWSAPPAPGTLLGPGSPAGTLTQLGRRYALRVPDGISGVVAGPAARDRERAVAYGEPLLRLTGEASARRGSRRAPAAAGRTEQGHRVVAPTDGVFYAAATPGGPPYAPAGARIAAGQTIGLIEVMKTFNPIVYGGESLPETVEIVEVLVGSGEEVRAGQALLVVR